MICVFDVIEGPARGKRFWLRANQRIAVGRISTADFSVPADSHMSRHHLIFEANCEVIRVRDAGSANGTFVNDARINSLELCAGDKIRAGATIIEISVLADHEDPHAKDGVSIITFSGRMTRSGISGAPAAGDATLAKVTLEAFDQADVASSPLISNPATSDQALAGSATSNPSGVENRFVRPPDEAPQAAAPADKPRALPVGTRVLRYEDPALGAPPSPDSLNIQNAGLQNAGLQNAGLQNPGILRDDDTTMRLDVQWWTPYFQPSAVPSLFEQRAGIESLNYLALIQRAAAVHPLGLVVNQSQLGRAATATLHTAVNVRLITQLSNTLLLVKCDGSDGVWQLVSQSLRQDALICLAANRTFDSAWLHEMLDQFSYPSMLGSLLQTGNQSLQKRFNKHLRFALFEKNRTGELSLYLNADRFLSST
ncbi:MAG: FHA domain-containing protein [Pirellulaceae bacterium]|nr:FHA domain-containing protein [Pirellulaceae bacterium]